MFRHTLLPVLLLTVAGCSDPIYDNPNGTPGGPTTGDQEQQEAYERYNDARDSAFGTAQQGAVIRETGLNTLASSNATASMTGAYEMTADSLLGAKSVVGEMTMEADFGAGTVSGELHNSYIDNTPGNHEDDDVEVLDGTVAYAGTIDTAADVPSGAAQIDAHGDGTFTDANSGTGYDLYVDIDGNFYRYGDSGELIGVSGGFGGNIDVVNDGSADLYDIDGDFVVCENTCQSQ